MRTDGMPLTPWRMLPAPPLSGGPLPGVASGELAAHLARCLPPASGDRETVMVDDGLLMTWLGNAERLADQRPGPLARLLATLVLPHGDRAEGTARLHYAARNWDAAALLDAAFRSLGTPRERRVARFCELAGPVAERALTPGPEAGLVVPALFPDEADGVSTWLEFLLGRPVAVVRTHDRVGPTGPGPHRIHPRVLGCSAGALPAEVVERALQEQAARSGSAPLVGVVRPG